MLARSFRLALATGFAIGAIGGIVVAWLAFSGGHLVSPVRVTLYGILPLIVAVVTAAAVIAGHRWRLLLAFYGAAVAVALSGAELYLQWRQYQADSRATPLSATIAAYPHACAANFLVERMDGSLESALDLEGSEILPLTGLAGNRLPGIGEDAAAWPTDAHGFNNPPDQWRPGEVAIAVTGDSFAFGADVPIGKGFVDRMRERAAPLVNLGCGGNGPLAELAALVEYGRLLEPRTVIWAYYEGNDLTKDIARENEAPLLRRYLEPEFRQSLAARNAEVQGVVREYLDRQRAAAPPPGTAAARNVINWPSAVRLEYLRTALGLVYGFKPPALTLLGEALARARDEVRAWGGELIFVYLPGEARFTSWTAAWDADGYRRAVLDQVTDLGIDHVDLAPVFAARPHPRDLFRGHYTEQGYALVADTIMARLAHSTR